MVAGVAIGTRSTWGYRCNSSLGVLNDVKKGRQKRRPFFFSVGLAVVVPILFSFFHRVFSCLVDFLFKRPPQPFPA